MRYFLNHFSVAAMDNSKLDKEVETLDLEKTKQAILRS